MGNLPIRQTQDEELNKCRFQQQLLVLGAEVREARDAPGPLPDHLHGGCEQIVELLDVGGVFFLVQADFGLVILKLQTAEEQRLIERSTKDSRRSD